MRSEQGALRFIGRVAHRAPAIVCARTSPCARTAGRRRSPLYAAVRHLSPIPTPISSGAGFAVRAPDTRCARRFSSR